MMEWPKSAQVSGFASGGASASRVLQQTTSTYHRCTHAHLHTCTHVHMYRLPAPSWQVAAGGRKVVGTV